VKLPLKIAVISLLLLNSFAYAQQPDSVPKLINYQGKLTNAEGMPLQNGNYEVRFTLWDATSGGNLVWGETRSVTLVAGVFNVALGGEGSHPVAGAPVSVIAYAFGSKERYLETTLVSGPGVAQEQTLAPRQQMVSVPFAFESDSAEEAQNSAKLAGELPSFWIPQGMIVAYGGESDPPGWLICDGRNVLRVGQYAGLFAIIGTRYGNGNGLTTFTIPNARGMVLRGTGSQSVSGRIKVGPALGAVQEDQMQRIQGEFSSRGFGNGGTFIQNGVGAFNTSVIGNAATSASTSSGTPGLTIVRLDSGGSSGARTSSDLAGETRVSSLGVNYIIKY
jgi:microcystin-dependent protein